MNCNINEVLLTAVKEYDFDKTDIHQIEKIFDKVIRDCHKKYFYKFEYRCISENKFLNIRNNEIVNGTIGDKSMGLYEINEKLKKCSRKGFYF